MTPTGTDAAKAIFVDDLYKSFEDVVTIIDGSGSGKSTMLRCIHILFTKCGVRYDP